MPFFPWIARPMAGMVGRMAGPKYPKEVVGEDYDNGTMQESVDLLEQQIVGRRIVKVEKEGPVIGNWSGNWGLVITLDNGKQVALVDTHDCCAYTELETFLVHHDKIDHIITGVGTTDGFQTWHIFADFGDIMEMRVGWSCGNPFYYGYGFSISVQEV